MKKHSLSLSFLLFYGFFTLNALPVQSTIVSTEELSPLKVMFAAQKNIQSLSADFTQTRALHTLRSPLLIKGKLWFQTPDQFRWELGAPPKLILIGNHHGVTIIYPSKKRAEKKPPAPDSSFSESRSLGMMRIPGKGNLEEFQKQMQVFCIKNSGSRCHIEMLPRDPAAARGLASIKFDFDSVTGHLLSFELVTSEGSSLLNEFSNIEINKKIAPELFEYDLNGFKVSDEKE